MKDSINAKVIAQSIDDYLTANGWHFHYFEDEDIFMFNLNLPSQTVKALKYLIIIHSDGFNTSVQFPLGADPRSDRKMTALARFFTRANYGMRVGNFELDMEDGDIRFTTYCSCPDALPCERQIEETIYTAAAMFKKFTPGILDVMFMDVSDKEAFEHCSNPRMKMGDEETEVEDDGQPVFLDAFLQLLEEKASQARKSLQQELEELMDMDEDSDDEDVL